MWGFPPCNSLPSGTLATAKLSHNALFSFGPFSSHSFRLDQSIISLTTPHHSIIVCWNYPLSPFFHEAILNIVFEIPVYVVCSLSLFLSLPLSLPPSLPPSLFLSPYLCLFYGHKYFYLIFLISWVKIKNIIFLRMFYCVYLDLFCTESG